jgi:hypothetical protein
MIEDLLIGIFIGFTLPFIIRNRNEILEYLKITIKRVEKK